MRREYKKLTITDKTTNDVVVIKGFEGYDVDIMIHNYKKSYDADKYNFEVKRVY
jgi:hypothetical protein